MDTVHSKEALFAFQLAKQNIGHNIWVFFLLHGIQYKRCKKVKIIKRKNM